MAAFCAFFAWCSPDLFWDLDLNEYRALAAVIRKAGSDGT